MTTGLTNAVMLGVMLLHAVFGCCWHHSHGACASGEAGSGAATVASERAVAAPHRCPCGRHGDAAGTPAEEAPPADEPCDGCGEVCHFLSAGEVSAPAADALWFGGTVDDPASVLAARSAGGLARSDGSPHAAMSATSLLTRLCVWRL